MRATRTRQEGAVDVVKCSQYSQQPEEGSGQILRTSVPMAMTIAGLHLASQNKNSKIVRLLIEAGANPFAWDIDRSPVTLQYNRPARLPSPAPSSLGSRIYSQVGRGGALCTHQFPSLSVAASDVSVLCPKWVANRSHAI
jgi:hypothetical protein